MEISSFNLFTMDIYIPLHIANVFSDSLETVRAAKKREKSKFEFSIIFRWNRIVCVSHSNVYTF